MNGVDLICLDMSYMVNTGEVDKEEQSSDENKFLEFQFMTLRKEIEDAKGRAFKILAGEAFAIPAAQFLIGIEAFAEGVHSLSITLPFLIIILVLRFVYENNSIIRCGKYIRCFIEPYYIEKYSHDLKDSKINGGEYKGWESWLEVANNREAEKIMKLSFYILSAIYYVVSVKLAEDIIEEYYKTIPYHEYALYLYVILGFFIVFITFRYVLTSTDEKKKHCINLRK